MPTDDQIAAGGQDGGGERPPPRRLAASRRKQVNDAGHRAGLEVEFDDRGRGPTTGELGAVLDARDRQECIGEDDAGFVFGPVHLQGHAPEQEARRGVQQGPGLTIGEVDKIVLQEDGRIGG
ncbi:hypothetical protein D3C86_1428710 [compost metagenome]